MKVEMENEELVIRLPLEKPTASKSSGKTLVVASSHGPQRSSVLVEARPVYVNVNAYVYPDRPASPQPTVQTVPESRRRKSVSKVGQREGKSNRTGRPITNRLPFSGKSCK